MSSTTPKRLLEFFRRNLVTLVDIELSKGLEISLPLPVIVFVHKLLEILTANEVHHRQPLIDLF